MVSPSSHFFTPPLTYILFFFFFFFSFLSFLFTLSVYTTKLFFLFEEELLPAHVMISRFSSRLYTMQQRSLVQQQTLHFVF